MTDFWPDEVSGFWPSCDHAWETYKEWQRRVWELSSGDQQPSTASLPYTLEGLDFAPSCDMCAKHASMWVEWHMVGHCTPYADGRKQELVCDTHYAALRDAVAAVVARLRPYPGYPSACSTCGLVISHAGDIIPVTQRIDRRQT